MNKSTRARRVRSRTRRHSTGNPLKPGQRRNPTTTSTTKSVYVIGPTPRSGVAWWVCLGCVVVLLATFFLFIFIFIFFFFLGFVLVASDGQSDKRRNKPHPPLERATKLGKNNEVVASVLCLLVAVSQSAEGQSLVTAP